MTKELTLEEIREEREALDAWLAEQANPSPFAIEMERRIGIYPSELHLVAIQAKREEDARILELLEGWANDHANPA